MSATIYLINLDTMSVTGVFSSVTDGEIAGEVAGYAYYVGDAQDLLRFTGKELRALMASVGDAFAGNIAKGDRVERIELAAQRFEFAPPPPPKPAPKAATAKVNGTKKVGMKAMLMARLEAGETVRLGDYPDHKPSSFTTALSDLRSAKYCGREAGPLNIIRVEKDAYACAPVDGAL